MRTIADVTYLVSEIDSTSIRIQFPKPANPNNHIVGFAWDPDLGYPGDDSSGYDAETGLLYAYDASRAVGMVMRRAGKNAVESVHQFGARRFAPDSPRVLGELVHDPTVDLLGGVDDVQFVVGSSVQGSANAAMTVFIIRAPDLPTLRRRLAEVLETE